MIAKNKFFVVTSGETPTLYYNWHTAKKAMSKHKIPHYKVFDRLYLAKEYLTSQMTKFSNVSRTKTKDITIANKTAIAFIHQYLVPNDKSKNSEIHITSGYLLLTPTQTNDPEIKISQEKFPKTNATTQNIKLDVYTKTLITAIREAIEKGYQTININYQHTAFESPIVKLSENYQQSETDPGVRKAVAELNELSKKIRINFIDLNLNNNDDTFEALKLKVLFYDAYNHQNSSSPINQFIDGTLQNLRQTIKQSQIFG